MLEVLIPLLESFGFPVFVVVWLLIKNSKDNERMVETLNELKLVINTLIHKMEAD